MNKIRTVLLLVGMLFVITACGNNDKSDNNVENGNTGNGNTGNVMENDAANTGNNDNMSGDNTGNVTDSNTNGTDNNASNTGETLGQTLLQDFVLRAEADDQLGAQELADAILTNDAIQFSGTTMEVQPGLLTGFDKEIQGFNKGIMFSPMIGSIPFVGYIFELEKEEDASAFMSTISENANPRWNVCTQADEIVMDHVGNKVFFLMCPANMEE